MLPGVSARGAHCEVPHHHESEALMPKTKKKAAAKTTSFVYHGEDGDAIGWSADYPGAERECGKPDTFGRTRHVWAIHGESNGDGQPCMCATFVRRVFDRCPTCRRQRYATAERAR